MSLKLEITKFSEDSYNYRFIFESDVHSVGISIHGAGHPDFEYESLLEALTKNNNYSCKDDLTPTTIEISVEDGLTRFNIFGIAQRSMGEMFFQLKNELCIDAIRQLVEHMKNHPSS